MKRRDFLKHLAAGTLAAAFGVAPKRLGGPELSKFAQDGLGVLRRVGRGRFTDMTFRAAKDLTLDDFRKAMRRLEGAAA